MSGSYPNPPALLLPEVLTQQYNGEKEMHYEETLDGIRRIVREYLAGTQDSIDTKDMRVPLMVPCYGEEEILQVVDSLLTKRITLNQTASNKVGAFETEWAGYIGTSEAVMFNSGSSANLIALMVLTNPGIENPMPPGTEVITPALTWTTTVAPIWCANCVPVFVDVDLETFTMRTEDIERAITQNTRAIMPVHLLGYPCDMENILRIAEKHGLYVVEDCCEAHGASIDGRKVGSYGHLSTFSFFFSHHLSTIEGGMLLTNKVEYAEIARTMRSQGVMRNAKDKAFENKYLKDERYRNIDSRYLFVNLGYNLRPTELNGGFGLEQFRKFGSFLDARRANASYFMKSLEPYREWILLPRLKTGIEHAWFALPIFVKENAPFQRRELETYLNGKGIETRQIMAGDITQQPVMELFGSRNEELANTKRIHQNAFFFGNHPMIGEQERQYIMECFREFLARYGVADRVISSHR